MVASIAQYFGLSPWGESLHADIDNLASPVFWAAGLQIIFFDILLSGDNAVVIAMACRDLPRRQRRWGMVIGAVAAVVLRIVFTVLIAQFLLLPYLKLAGGLVLFYIAAKLLVPEPAAADEVEAASHVWRAVGIVVVADVIMSLDNIIAIAAAANGNVLLLVTGLAVSIPLIIAGAVLIMALLDRLPILVWAGAGLLGWVAGQAMATDPAVAGYVTGALGGDFAEYVELAAAVAGAALVIVAGGVWRHLHLSNVR
jgi:YjbE family integral membrane protein